MIHSSAAMLVLAAAGLQTPLPSQPLRAGWQAVQFEDGTELRYLPLQPSFKDYPKDANRAGVEGTSVVNLKIDPSGQVVGCTVAQSAGWPSLDEGACLLYRKRGRFELRGTAAPINIDAPVRWVLMDSR